MTQKLNVVSKMWLEIVFVLSVHVLFVMVVAATPKHEK